MLLPRIRDDSVGRMVNPADTHPDAYLYADRDANARAVYRNSRAADRYSHGDSDADRDVHSLADLDALPDSHADGFADRHADAHSDADSTHRDGDKYPAAV